MSNALSSWKEIAQFFGKGVRTVQRWETQYGLPVRRTLGDGSVLAIPDELNTWLHAQKKRARPDVDDLRREVVALRAENASLRHQREDPVAASPLEFQLDYELLVRSSWLISETRHLIDYTTQLQSWSRNLREMRQSTTVH